MEAAWQPGDSVSSDGTYRLYMVIQVFLTQQGQPARVVACLSTALFVCHRHPHSIMALMQ